MLIDTAVILNYLNARLDGINELIPSSEEEIKSIKQSIKPYQKQIPMQVESKKIEVEIVDLPAPLARVASAAINNKLRSDEKKKRINEMCNNLF
jgi:hypothetical protein